MRIVDLVDVRRAQRAFAGERFVDVLIERGIIAGGVGVPDFVIAWIGRLAQRLDLAERDFRERQGALVFVSVGGHFPTPLHGPFWPALPYRPGRNLTDRRERGVNTYRS